MDNILTPNKLINLYVYFYFNYQWQSNNIDYIKEKYFLIFNSLPTKKIKKSKKFKEEYNFWDKRWRTMVYEDEQKLLLGMFHMCNGFLTPKDLLSRYNELFDSYEYINEELQMHRLHKISRTAVEKWINLNQETLNKVSRKAKILKLKNSINP